jgi:putative component of toxin-antitoxin plasmid stabilization module
MRADGSEPFTDWLRRLRDADARSRVRQRLARIRLGMYYGHEDLRIVILLCGGDKATQDRDIERAKEFWKDHRSRSHDQA